ncbi:MAG: phage holin family protein [Cytophagaceae bacterium]
MNFILIVLINGAGVWVISKILKGVSITSVGNAIWTGFLIAALNGTIGYVARILTLPINWLTLGLMSFVITVLIIILVDKLVKGFKMANYFWAILFALLLGIFNSILQTILLI